MTNLLAKAISAVRRSITPQEFVTGADLEGGTLNRFVRPYAQSVWVRAALNLVTQPIKAVPLKLYLGDVEFKDPAVKAFWSKPAVGMTYEEFVDATCGWFKLAGEFFWILDDTWLLRGSAKSRLIVARPDQMREIVEGGELIGWEYRDATHRRHSLIPEQVVHLKNWNPYNAHRGLGELEAAALGAETDFLAGRFARDSYANMGEQGDYVIGKGTPATAEQQAQITAALRAKRAAKMRGDFRPVFLTGDFAVQSPAITGPDAAMVANRLQSRHEVFIAFGVPASMADVAASYSIGSASDYFRLIHQTCLPLATSLAGAIDRLLLSQTGQAVEAFFDFDEHPTMQAVRNERIEAAIKLWGTGMPMREVNAYLDMGLPQFPGWEQGYLPFSLQPAGEPLPDETPEPQAPADDTMDDAVAAMIRAIKSCPAHGNPEPEQKGKRSDLWQAHWRSRQETIKTYASKFNKLLMTARGQVMANLQKFAKGKGPNIDWVLDVSDKAAVADLNFDLEEMEDGITVEFGKAGRAALDRAGRQAKAEVGQPDDAWSMPPAKAVSFLKGRENFLRDIADSVHQAIEEQLVAGIEAGETMTELADRVRGTFNGISKARAMTIASTETAAAYGAARQEALEQSGIEWKEWLTSGNDNVRPSHQVAEGQRRRISEPFNVGGASLMHPGDGSLGAPPEETINCHCVEIAAEGGPTA
jgi:SPP1 gp7 family putative phage head morphogenesis protein